MGVIARKLRDKHNQAIAATRLVSIPGTVAEVTAKLVQWIEATNAQANAEHEARVANSGKVMKWLRSGEMPSQRSYEIRDKGGQIDIAFGVRLDTVYRRGFRAVDHAWLAQLFPRPDGENTKLQFHLKFWAVNDAGLIWNGACYAKLVNEGLVGALGATWLSEPLDPEDQRFIRRTL